jgi:hypothetical protein
MKEPSEYLDKFIAEVVLGAVLDRAQSHSLQQGSFFTTSGNG